MHERDSQPGDTEISISIRALDSNPRDSGFPRGDGGGGGGDNEIPARILNRTRARARAGFSRLAERRQRYDKISHSRACHRISFAAL